MVDKWTGLLVGKMHNNGVTFEALAKELGVSKPYVSMVLNGKRFPKDAEQKFNDALNKLIASKNLVSME